MSDDKDALIYLANVRIDELDAENAKLREELEKWNRLAENIELPEYPVTEFHPKDLERENAKLRELVGERQRDAVEVVRCRDCKHFAVDQSDHDYRTGWWCKRWYTDMVKPDGFCAWGKRKEQE